MDRIYTPTEVAKILHIRTQTVYMLLQSGTLGAYRTGNRWKIPGYCVEDYMKGMVEHDKETEHSGCRDRRHVGNSIHGIHRHRGGVGRRGA